MTTLRWPKGRGTFVERDPDRNPDDGDVPFRIRADTTVEIDDAAVVDHYLERGFELVGERSTDDDTADTDDTAADADAEPEAEPDDTDDGFDAEAFTDRTPVSDVVDDIAAGKADGHLDAVKAADGRVTIERAVNDRKSTLGEE